jgi:hypothetical protein
MIKRYPQSMQEESGVMISLAISIGMIILAVVGWWMWKIFAPIAQAIFAISPSEVP